MPRDHEGRPDAQMAENIEDVLRTVAPYRRLHAAQLMRSLGVPFRVIVRVLAEPNKRRNSPPSQDTGVQARYGDLPSSRKNEFIHRA
jgi:hypothetical protein